MKGCYSIAVDDRFAFEAELHAFIITIEKAVEFNWNNLWIESDSSMVISAFIKRAGSNSTKDSQQIVKYTKAFEFP